MAQTAPMRRKSKRQSRGSQVPRLLCNVARLVPKRLQFCCRRHTFPDTGSRSHLLSWPPLMERSILLPRPLMEARGSGAVRFCPSGNAWDSATFLALQIETCAPFNSCLAWPVVPCLFSYLLCILSDYCSWRTLIGPLCESFFGYLQDWARAGTFEPSSPII